jgi:hypothetical protein
MRTVGSLIIPTATREPSELSAGTAWYSPKTFDHDVTGVEVEDSDTGCTGEGQSRTVTAGVEHAGLLDARQQRRIPCCSRLVASCAVISPIFRQHVQRRTVGAHLEIGDVLGQVRIEVAEQPCSLERGEQTSFGVDRRIELVALGREEQAQIDVDASQGRCL